MPVLVLSRWRRGRVQFVKAAAVERTSAAEVLLPYRCHVSTMVWRLLPLVALSFRARRLAVSPDWSIKGSEGSATLLVRV